MNSKSLSGILTSGLGRRIFGFFLLAGILPGLLQALSYSVMLYFRFRANPELGPSIPAITCSRLPCRVRCRNFRGCRLSRLTLTLATP